MSTATSIPLIAMVALRPVEMVKPIHVAKQTIWLLRSRLLRATICNGPPLILTPGDLSAISTTVSVSTTLNLLESNDNTVTVYISAPVGTGDQDIDFSCADTGAVTTATQVTIPEGKTSVTVIV